MTMIVCRHVPWQLSDKTLITLEETCTSLKRVITSTDYGETIFDPSAL